MQTHEALHRDETVKTSSDRFFGLLFFVVFLLIALWPLLKGKPVYPIPLGIALAFLAAALVVPKWLAPLNRLWMKFGELLHRIVSPVILGIMFFGVITPVGWLMRLAGKDLLRTKFDRDADSYWIRREPPGPESSSMKRQF
ncbi:MAG: SxtJ family membrane protein [Pseudomonadota bacterium]